MKLKNNEFETLEEAVETGIAFGVRRYLKHIDVHDEVLVMFESDAFSRTLADDIMNCIDDKFDFELCE